MLPKKLQELRRPRDNENFLIEAHHVLMRKYGWIPLEEFKELPIPTFWSLINEMNKEAKSEEKMMKKAKMRRR